MWKWLLKRFFIFVPTFIGASFIAFTLIRLVPGDPVTNLLGDRGGTPERVAEVRAALGLDKSLPEQYWLFLKGASHADFGISTISQRPVSEEFFDRFPATVELSMVALLWATLLGIPLGIMAAVKRNTTWDYGVMGFSLVGYSMPIFWWGLLLVLLFSVNLGWLPVSGRLNVIYDVQHITGFMLIDTWFTEEPWLAFWDACRHLVLPALVLGTIPLAIVARITRASMLEILQEDYLRTAKALGIPELRRITVYAFRNALIPVITVMGLLVGTLLTGAVLTESIFSWPGVGRWLIKSVEARDYPVIQGGILYTSLAVIFANLAVDALYAWANPRLRKS